EMQPVGETEFAERTAEESLSRQNGSTRVAAGIVAYANLSLGSEVARVLEAHLQASPRRLRGVRDAVTWDPDPANRGSAARPGRMADARYRAGFACLQRYGLSYDAWLYHTQLMELAALAKAFPN